MPRTSRISRQSTPSSEEKRVRVHSAPRRKKSVSAPAPQIVAAPQPARTDGQGFSLHVAAAVAAVIAVVVLSQGALRDGAPSFMAQLLPSQRIEIGLEHARPVTLVLSLTTNGTKGVADIRHDSLETIALSLPQSWTKREVGGVPLAAVTADPPTFGFTRWSIPPGAIVSFDVTPPSTILLHNPSGVPAEIRLTRVDLEQNAVERDILLVQEGSILLW
ncbi:MAG: hypothetical protein ABIG34_03460 [Candidatus Peregrinibacteria bacterium]